MISAADQALFEELFRAGVDAARPEQLLARHLPPPPKGRTVVVGAGKSAGQMVAALEAVWEGPLEGVAVTRYGYGCPTKTIPLLQAAHPVPDQAGAHAARRLAEAVAGLSANDLVIALISGGGSALLPSPIAPMTLDDEIALNEALLASGAPISAMNAIRAQFSTIKAGRLALAAHPAPVVTLVISDVPGDDPALVASGPTVPQNASQDAARRLIGEYGIDLPEAARKVLADPANAAPDPQDDRFANNRVAVIASAALSLEAAAEVAKAHAITPVILSDAIEGEAREIAKMHAAIARQIAHRDRPFEKPVLVLSGGETTVTLPKNATGARGGRNGEFLLSLALEIDGIKGISAFAADTDGVDGTEDNAGAFAGAQTARQMRQKGIDPRMALNAHQSYDAFKAIGALFVPGPTGTNVNDLRAILIR